MYKTLRVNAVPRLSHFTASSQIFWIDSELAGICKGICHVGNWMKLGNQRLRIKNNLSVTLSRHIATSSYDFCFSSKLGLNDCIIFCHAYCMNRLGVTLRKLLLQKCWMYPFIRMCICTYSYIYLQSFPHKKHIRSGFFGKSFWVCGSVNFWVNITTQIEPLIYYLPLSSKSKKRSQHEKWSILKNG